MAENIQDEPNEQKDQIERAIVRARDGVGDRIDELDRHLRTTLDPKTFARTYAPRLIAGGAAVGLLVGFGMPKVIRKVIKLGVPVALLAFAIKNARR